MTALPWVYDDGGRADAGFRGETRDCVTRAIAIATGIPYIEVYDALAEGNAKYRGRRSNGKRTARNGIWKPVRNRYLASLGWEWTPTMFVGSGTTVHLREGELPAEGRLIVAVSRHLVALIDGTLHDTADPARSGQRCVYGFFSASTEARLGEARLGRAARGTAGMGVARRGYAGPGEAGAP